jgi:hypothetical protein
MKAEIAECTVVEIKFKAGIYEIVAELAPIGHIHMVCPFEHLLRVGDKIKLFVDIPLALQRIDPAKLFGGSDA